MPSNDDIYVKSSWADEVEDEEEEDVVVRQSEKVERYSEEKQQPQTHHSEPLPTVLPEPVIDIDGNSKTLTEYSWEEEDPRVMVKTISYFKIEKHCVAKSIAKRKAWKKFGLSSNDKQGPNPATTITAEEVGMQFISPNDEESNEHEDLKKKLLDSQKGQVKCRLCKEDHWTKKCPYKDTLEPLRTSLMGEGKDEDDPAGASGPTILDDADEGDNADKGAGGSLSTSSGKYVPPSMREGASKMGESMGSNRRVADETATVRVTNLSESTREQDLQELFQPFGEISRIFLAKDKYTMLPKGFAFINYKYREEAAKAINVLNGYGYDHLILNVEWARPSTTSTNSSAPPAN